MEKKEKDSIRNPSRLACGSLLLLKLRIYPNYCDNIESLMAFTENGFREEGSNFG